MFNLLQYSLEQITNAKINILKLKSKQFSGKTLELLQKLFPQKLSPRVLSKEIKKQIKHIKYKTSC